jgi:hypothetical protein
MTMTITGDLQNREAFRAQREDVMALQDDEMIPIVDEALRAYYNGEADWYDEPIEAAAVLWWETFEFEQGRAPTPAELARFQSTTATVLERTAQPTTAEPDDTQVQVVAGWLSAYALNSATAAGGGPLEWVTMRDGDVRDIHVPLDGQENDRRGLFDVAGYRLHFPGEPVGPPHVWINCRCVCRQVARGDDMGVTAAGEPGEAVEDVEDSDVLDEAEGDYTELDSDVQWHGVIAPTGVRSGDQREFTSKVLRTRELPVPLTYQRAQSQEHDGAVTVGNIERIWEEDGLIKAEGRFTTSPEAEEAIAMVGDHMLRGVSVELDDVTVQFQNVDGSPYDPQDTAHSPVQVVTDGRVSSATMVTVPAFQEAFIALGPWDPEEVVASGDCAPCAFRQEMDDLADSWVQFAISEAQWDGSESRFTPEEWFRSTTVHRSDDASVKSDHSLPILEPNGDLSRAGVHAAAARIGQVDAPPEAIATAKRALITAYNKLEEDPPEALTASAFGDVQVQTFAPGTTHDGPGWITNPEDSQRLRTYWTRGKGAAKIRWGQPGDFNRCRKQLAKYVPNPNYLAGTCANLHKVALGVWPGREGGGNRASLRSSAAPSFMLADPDVLVRPHEWFEDPHLPAATALTVDGDRVFGHIAAWETCHTGQGVSVGDGDLCVRPPNSASGYAYYLVGEVDTDDGPRSVGHITMGTGHAPDRAGPRVAAAHYDNTGAVIADVACGEDQFGIWFSGALRPGVGAEQVAALRAAALSGDWRRIGGQYELVAALAVNVPGFPIPRTVVTASGRTGHSLVAAGVVPHLDAGVDLRELVREQIAQVHAEQERSVRRATVMAQVRRMQTERARAQLGC